MSYFDDASLVLIPSGYKDQKLYAVKPLDGAGDLAFSRASSATRVASNGLIEKVRTNLALQSQTLSVSPTWTAYSGTTITADAVAAPDGTLTADQISGTSGAFRGIRQTITSSAVPHTFSVYLRSATGSSTTARIWVDSGVSTVTVTTSWQRFSVTATTASSFDIQISTAVSSAIDVYAWGAQLETSDIATEYIATTSAAVSVGPVSGLPRLDYLNSTCPRLLLEPQRTNTITFSEDVASCLTSQVGTTVTANATASPDGYQSADLVAFTANSYRLRGQTVAAATTYTMSVFFKNNTFSGTESILFNMSDGVIGGLTASIQPANGTATFSAAPAAWTSVSGKVENYGNGWYRVSVTGTSVSGGGGWYELASISAIKSAYFWGFSLEIGAYATSYIPTLGTSVTRVADAASKTGISSLIGQTEGTLFVECVVNGLKDNNTVISVNNGSLSEYLVISGNGSGQVNAFILDGGVEQAGILSGVYAVGTVLKCALAYKQNDVAYYINGVQIGTDTSATMASTSQVDIGNLSFLSAPFHGTVNQALLFKTRLTNAQLAELTTL